MTQRSRLPLHVLSVIVVVSLVFPSGLISAAPTAPVASATPSRDGWSVAEAIMSVGDWFTGVLRSAVAGLPSSAPAQAVDTTPVPTPVVPTPTPSAPTPVPTEPPPEEESSEPVDRHPSDAEVVQTVGPEGGRIVLPDGVVTIDIPAAATVVDVELRLRTSPTASVVPEEEPWFTWLYFSLEPTDERAAPDGHLVFTHPVTITIDLSRFPEWSLPWLLHETEEDTPWWDRVEARHDPEGSFLTAQVTTFSA